jgi:uncharacterized membrane protein YbhN (UPF0104 family)
LNRAPGQVFERSASGGRRWLTRAVLLRCVGVVLLGMLLLRVPVDAVASALGRADLPLVATTILLLAPFFALKSWRWQLLLQTFGVPIRFQRALNLYFVGLFAGYATPGQLGEAVKALYLKRDGFGAAPVMASIVLDRLADLALLVVLASVGIPLLGLEAVGAESVLVLVGVAALLVVLLSSIRPLRARLGRALSAGATRIAHVDWTAGRRALVGNWPVLVMLTVLAYVVHFGRYYVLLLAVHADMPIVAFVVVLSIVSLAALLPISPMGVGTRDLALVALFDIYGIPAPVALAFSTLILATYVANLPLGFVAWLREGKSPAR